MRETAKNYEDRVKNGDFSRYLHGYGIDIGGGDDCLILPPGIKGKVRLWDLKDGDAQYLWKIRDEAFDFVYSSHCLEHMRNINVALKNWIRVCKRGGVLYICVPHETYYEKGVWPSVNNLDHKHSFTLNEGSGLPKNVVIKDFLDQFRNYVEVIDIRENLKNYDFTCDRNIDQTADYEKKVCAQFDIILRKKKSRKFSKREKVWEGLCCFKDYIIFLLPIRIYGILPAIIQAGVRYLVGRMRKYQIRT